MTTGPEMSTSVAQSTTRADIGAVSYWCARSVGSEFVGAYDGLEAWTIYAGSLTERNEQLLVSLLEFLRSVLRKASAA